MSDYNEGDLIEAVKGESVVRGRLRMGTPRSGNAGYRYVGDSAALDEVYLRDGWTITVIEKAEPPLPIVPGIYVETNAPFSHTNMWELSLSGRWSSLAGSKYDGRVAEFAPLTKLEPVAETAKRVVDFAIDKMQHGIFKSPDLVRALLREFDLFDKDDDE